MEKLIIEVYSLHGIFQNRYIYDNQIMSVGSAYDNDLILRDEHIVHIY